MYVSVNAQYYRIDDITTSDGLSQNDINCITQDSYGFIWYGTNDGVNRSDGLNFKIYYKGSKSLTSGIISVMCEDKSQNLWIASLDNGLNRLNLRTGKVEEVFYKNSTENTLIGNRVVDVVCDSSGIVWYATFRGVGKIEKDNEGYKITNYLYKEKKTRRAKLYIDQENRLWVITSDKVRLFRTNKLELIEESSGGAYREIFEHAGKVYLIGGKQIWTTDFEKPLSSKKSVLMTPVGSMRTALIDYSNNLWVGTNKGLFKYKYDSEIKKYLLDQRFEVEKREQGIQNLDVRSLHKDKTGIIYVGTYGDGIKKINPKGKKFRHFLPKKEGVTGKIRSICQDSEGKIYIGDHEGNVFIFDDETMIEKGGLQKRALHENIERNVITINEIVSANGEKSVVAGSEYNNSLRIIGGKNIDLPKIRNSVFAIVQGADKLVWIGTYGNGLFRYDPVGVLPLKNFKHTLNADSITSDIIRTLCFDAEGRLWIGTGNGLCILSKEEQRKSNPKFERYQHDPNNSKSISYNYILNIVRTSNNDMWLGTMGEGLNKLTGYTDGRAEFKVFKTDDGLASNVIRAVVEDDSKNLWVSTNRGISKLNPETNSIENYTVDDGLQDYEFSDLAGCKLHSGKLLFGGVNGINIFYPMEIKTDWSKAIPVFTSLTILNREIQVGDTISNSVVLKEDINVVDKLVKKYKNNSFSIGFAALHYALPSKNKCKYMLEGFDADWHEAKSGERAKYTNLKPGNYTFRLMAANSDGVWNGKEKTLKIVIKPHFMLTKFMFVVYGLMGILVLFFFRKFSIIDIHRKHELSLAELEKKKDNELNKLKIQFFMNVSHEFKTPLTLIVNPLEQILSKGISVTETKLKEYHEVMLRNAKLLLRLINQLTDFRKMELGIMKLNIEKINPKDLLAKLHESFSLIAIKKEIDFNFKVHGLVDDLWVDTDKLEKVLNNLLSNAFKYTDEGGTIDFELIDDNSEYLTIIVSDNGIGISEEEQGSIYDRYFLGKNKNSKVGTGIGLAYTRSLVDLMQGKIEFKSKLDEGTVFFLKLPKDKSVFNKENTLDENLVVTTSAENINLDESLYLDNNKLNIENKLHNDELFSILIVEDNPDLCQFLNDFFSENYNVNIAVNGKEGVEKCKELNPDLIITDVSMPVMDGNEMTKNLKTSFESSHIPIIMLTAHSSDFHKIKGFSAGADLYLSKPFNIHLLASQVVSLLKNRQLMRDRFVEKINIEPSDISPTNKDEEFIKNVLQIVEENMSESNFTVKKLAEACGYSQRTLNTKLFALTNQKANTFVRSLRLKRACQHLLHGELSVSEVTYEVGFNDLRYFRECFVAEYNCLPSEYKSKYGKE